MKIGILTERLVSGFGVDLVVDAQADRLGKNGHDVQVFVLRANEFRASSNYKLSVFSQIRPKITDFASPPSIEAWLEQNNADTFDVWILHTPPFYGWVRYLNTPVVFVEYGSPPVHFFDQATAYSLWKLASNHFRNDYGCLRKGDAIVSISQSIHDALPAAVRGYSTVQLLGADHYAQADLSAVGKFRMQHGVKPDEFLVLWVGRMQFARDEQPYKGFPDVLRLLPAIRSLSPKVKIALLGKIDSSERHHLKTEDVILLANHPFEEMGVAYAAADVLLNLSRWEGFNLALVEAQYQGTPVIAFDVGPHPEVCRDGKTGVLIKDISEVIPALHRLFEDTRLQKQMAVDARIFAREFRWDRNVAQLQSTLEACQTEGGMFRGLSREPIEVQIPERLKPYSFHELLLLDGDDFVRAAFRAILRREPDAETEQFFLQKLARHDKLHVLLDISNSEEAVIRRATFDRLEKYRNYGKLRRRYRLWRDLRRARRLRRKSS